MLLDLSSEKVRQKILHHQIKGLFLWSLFHYCHSCSGLWLTKLVPIPFNHFLVLCLCFFALFIPLYTQIKRLTAENMGRWCLLQNYNGSNISLH